MAMFESRPVRRRDHRGDALIAALVVALAWAGWNATQSPAVHDEAADVVSREPRITVTASLVNPRFVATRALTDFGLEVGAHYVAVRILAAVELDVDIRADRDVALGLDSRLCLIGPYAQPDYAGLAEPCWGAPDLGATLRQQLPVDGSGQPILRAGVTVSLRASLMRDPARCDYPPGDWQLELDLSRESEGAVTDLRIAPVELELQAATIGPLPLIRPTNYCGLANVAYLEQGEPLVTEH